MGFQLVSLGPRTEGTRAAGMQVWLAAHGNAGPVMQTWNEKSRALWDHIERGPGGSGQGGLVI